MLEFFLLPDTNSEKNELENKLDLENEFNLNENLFFWPLEDNNILINKNLENFGFIESVIDGVIRVNGMYSLAYGELVKILDISGFACNLNIDSVDILVLGDDRNLMPGMPVHGTHRGLMLPVAKRLLGHVINPLGELIDGSNTNINYLYYADINVKAPGIIFRQRVSEPMFTGIKVIDSLIPIGRGQRELIIGDKGTGKTSICFDAILNQKSENFINKTQPMYCIYVAIGQKRSSVKTIYDNLMKLGAMDYTVIVAATASDNAGLQYLAPYSGCALAEYFMSFGHSLIIYDDLSQHAIAYRQISLLLRRPPGREAYPGDVFYLHSRLLERAVKLHEKFGGGSITALPVVETLFGDVTAYIPTNVISITDGQIFLDKNLFTEGTIPAVNIGLSVSRVGSAAQILAMKKIAGSLKLELAQFREVKDFVKFGSDLSDETIYLINKGKLLTELLKQKRFSPVTPEEQILILFSGLNGFLDSILLSKITDFFNNLKSYIFNSVFFELHYILIRFENYFKEFTVTVLELLLRSFLVLYKTNIE